METTMPDPPQSNASFKWAKRTIMERVRFMLVYAGRSKKYWEFAVSVAHYLKNCTLTQSVVGKTPNEAWPGRKPC
jgi:hypothetical protein